MNEIKVRWAEKELVYQQTILNCVGYYYYAFTVNYRVLFQ